MKERRYRRRWISGRRLSRGDSPLRPRQTGQKAISIVAIESTAAVPAADRRRIEFAYDPPSSPVAHFAVAKWTRTADLDRVSVDDGQAHPATVLQNGTWAASRAKGSGRPDQLE